ncbi:hypothetical protein [Aminobacter sp. AP02]|uniref:hypothetical protein n=1 Tax=Aminobacter sp. AP02 TaxID=2135737 RepID=UPI000D799C5D|nr:hypothetical protein [Aminobacter sp. AP02]PWK68482.1 hypothetical protein C8K44_110159 [Aminobacter sp. AP02]
MRVLLFAVTIFCLLAAPATSWQFTTRAQAQECTGENCPKPSGQGRDCEQKKEKTVS